MQRRILIAPDKFKGTLSAAEAADAIRAGMASVWPDAHFSLIPLADGGDGFTECLVNARGGRMHEVASVDALHRPCIAHWGEIDVHTAVLEIASASGLAALAAHERDPLAADTFGSGVVLRTILGAGIREVLFGLGGSATNDGGMGIARALGYRFLDRNSTELESRGASLAHVVRIENPIEPVSAEIVIATDVDNPLFGANGAAEQFARQKGADDAAVRQLDDGLRHFASVVTAHTGRDPANAPGAGAAGGAGFGLMALLDARRRRGFELLSEYLNLTALIDAHQLVVTGEGAFDQTSLAGKAPAEIAKLAQRRGRPAWAVFGRCDDDSAADLFERHAELGAINLHVSRSEHAHRLAHCAAELARASQQ